MSDIVQNYYNEIVKVYKTGETTEHSYRPALVSLIENINKWVKAINEPKLTEVWRPDLLIRKKDITIWVLEAKDLDVSLDESKNQEQLKRYYSAFTNFCYTNSLEFRFYKFWELVESIIIAKLENGKIVPIESNFWKLEEFLKDFLSNSWEIIKNSKDLAKIMAWKARLLNETILKIMHTEHWEESNLRDQYKAFKDALVHDITIESFSDMYSQTIVYGLFVARLHDKTLEDFSRAEAERLIPKSNPFLKDLFRYVAYELEENVERIIDDLVEIYAHSDLWKILEDFWKTTWRNDPVVHFYEDFLWWYNPKTKKSRWVYYTPEPVVNFIIRWIDYLLKTEFDIPEWISDCKKETFKRRVRQKDGVDVEEHRVQILDVATWTWTFLNEIIKFIYNNSNYSAPALWSKYVKENLIPRLFGFELLMAPYTMTHLKLWLTLRETWYKDEWDQRLNVYLTNSLEEPDENVQSLFIQSFAREAEKANEVKRDAPIMVITWNPPYSVSSCNKWKWIQNLIKDYKKGLDEKKNNLDDDYIKFIRLAQEFIDKNKSWVIWMITSNSYIYGVTHRQMRKSLLESFDKIYIYDLHGNSRKKETCPDGSKDENVFDIMTGVCIIFAVKTSNRKSEKAEVFHFDSWWRRQEKYDRLWDSWIWNIERNKLNPDKEYHFFVPKDFSKQKKYDNWVKIDELFFVHNSGIKTDRDSLFYDFDKNELKNRFNILLSGNCDENFKNQYRIIDSSSYKLTSRIINKKFDDDKIKESEYKPYDTRYIYYDESIISRPWYEVMYHMTKWNIWLSLMRSLVDSKIFNTIKATNHLVDLNFYWFQTYLFPLYLYEDEESLLNWQKYRPNFNTELLAQIENQLWMKCNQKAKLEESNLSQKWATEFTPTDLFDYIYAVLHSPKYRETYKEFLKIDFPRVPFNVDRSTFWYLVEKGRELRLFHLLQHPKLSEKSDIAVYSWEWEDIIAFADYSNNKVYINGDKYFDNVPKEAWEFYIWWYQPAQRRFKDRKWRKMTFDDITHYQKMIISLNETIRLMKLIDMINFID